MIGCMQTGMQIALFTGSGSIEIREAPIPRPAEGEALVKVLACGVCGTDAHIFAGHIRNARPPVVLGHEIYGQVEALGPGARGVREGDRVAVDPFLFCGACPPCKRGEYRYCDNETFLGYHRAGGFAQYTPVPAANLYPLAPRVGRKAGVLIETLSTVIAGLSRLAPEPGRSFLLLGAGTVGLLWNRLLRGPAACLIQTDLVAERRALARAFGADRVLSPREEPLEEAVRALCPGGVDYLIDATGSAAAVQEALPLLRRGGTFMAFGICPEEERLSLSLNWFYRQQVRFLTSRRPPREMARAVALAERGGIEAERLVTGLYPLPSAAQAFRRFFEARDREIKMAIEPWVT